MDGEINPVLAAGINHTVAGASDESIADIATQGIPTALISGMTQLANAAESVADVVGLGWGQLEVAKVVHEADDLLNTDLGAYYAKHQEGVDLVGFLGSSLVIPKYRTGRSLKSVAFLTELFKCTTARSVRQALRFPTWIGELDSFLGVSENSTAPSVAYASWLCLASATEGSAKIFLP